MSIKTPVHVCYDAAIGRHVILDDNGSLPHAAEIAHTLNTHAALRASHAELVKALKTADKYEIGNGEMACALRTLYRTALSNAAKVEVGQ